MEPTRKLNMQEASGTEVKDINVSDVEAKAMDRSKVLMDYLVAHSPLHKNTNSAPMVTELVIPHEPERVVQGSISLQIEEKDLLKIISPWSNARSFWEKNLKSVNSKEVVEGGYKSASFHANETIKMVELCYTTMQKLGDMIVIVSIGLDKNEASKKLFDIEDWDTISHPFLGILIRPAETKGYLQLDVYSKGALYNAVKMTEDELVEETQQNMKKRLEALVEYVYAL